MSALHRLEARRPEDHLPTGVQIGEKIQCSHEQTEYRWLPCQELDMQRRSAAASPSPRMSAAARCAAGEASHFIESMGVDEADSQRILVAFPDLWRGNTA